MTIYCEPAPAKLNLALHVRGKLPDGRHELDTVFAFCTDGDTLSAVLSPKLSLAIEGPFAADVEPGEENLVLRAARALKQVSGTSSGAALRLVKKLPVASGIGGGSADAAAALRLLTRLWHLDPAHASRVAPGLGSDVPACLLSMTARGAGAGDDLVLHPDAGIGGNPVLLVNPLVQVPTSKVFSAWRGKDSGPISDWREGGNDLEKPARSLAPVIGDILDWLESQPGAAFPRMSGSGATCFAMFSDESLRDRAAQACPRNWWHLSTYLR